jgi:hypothetical protein
VDLKLGKFTHADAGQMNLPGIGIVALKELADGHIERLGQFRERSDRRRNVAVLDLGQQSLAQAGQVSEFLQCHASGGPHLPDPARDVMLDDFARVRLALRFQHLRT